MSKRRKRKKELSVFEYVGFFILASGYLIYLYPALLLIPIVVGILKYISRTRKRMKDLQCGIEKIDKMDPFEFEAFIANLFILLGFRAYVTSKSGDYGADVIVTRRDGIRIAVQVKRYNSSVGSKYVSDVYAAQRHYNCKEAILVTNNYFTKNATKLAKDCNIVLWDRDKLVDVLNSILVTSKGFCK